MENDPQLIYQPIIKKSMVWTTALKPMHVVDLDRYINICGLPYVIGKNLIS